MLFLAPIAAAQRGLTLLETLVAMVILSVGVLGMVGLQAWALATQRDTRWSTHAQSMARELAELMRSNRQVAIHTDPAHNPYLGSFAPGALHAPHPNYCLTESPQGCPNTTDVAHAHLTDWLARLAHTLPSARVHICWDAQPYDSQGQPQWDCTPSETALPHIKIGWSQRSTDRQRTQASALLTPQHAAPRLVLPVHSGEPLPP